jgi:hypothetical protein
MNPQIRLPLSLRCLLGLFWASLWIITLSSPVSARSSTVLLAGFRDLPSFANRLKHPSREVDIWIAGQLSFATRTALTNYTGLDSDQEAMQSALLQDLNRILAGPSIYSTQRFRGITLASETQTLLLQNTQGEKLRHLNRLLIEAAYPQEVESGLGVHTLRASKQGGEPSPGSRGSRPDRMSIQAAFALAVEELKNAGFRFDGEGYRMSIEPSEDGWRVSCVLVPRTIGGEWLIIIAGERVRLIHGF